MAFTKGVKIPAISSILEFVQLNQLIREKYQPHIDIVMKKYPNGLRCISLTILFAKLKLLWIYIFGISSTSEEIKNFAEEVEHRVNTKFADFTKEDIGLLNVSTVFNALLF